MTCKSFSNLTIAFGFLLLAHCVVSQRFFNIVKPGDCPPARPTSECIAECTTDVHCPAKAKCCQTQCGAYMCSQPVTEVLVGGVDEKAGSCPLSPTGPWICTSRCSRDTDCRRNYKCCKNRCGALACMGPEVEIDN